MKKLFKILTVICFLTLPTLAFAEQGLDLLTVTPNADGGQTYSTTIQILLIMTVLSLLPTALITMTSFTRIIVVLSILRQALGTASTPSNQVLIGLALFTSIFIMTPVFEKAYDAGIKPYIEDKMEFTTAMQAASQPLRDFMLNQTRENDLAMFADMAGLEQLEGPEDTPFSVLLPAFVTSELKTAFQIGFMIFIPFLIIDLVVASVLMSMGMMMLSPMLISMPFKIMLFVLVDGWSLILGTLASSFYT